MQRGLALVGPALCLFASVPGWWALALTFVLSTLSFRFISEIVGFSSAVFSSELLGSISGMPFYSSDILVLALGFSPLRSWACPEVMKFGSEGQIV